MPKCSASEAALASIDRNPKHKSVSTKDELKSELAISNSPTTLQSWLFGVLSGGQDSWIMDYMNSEFYKMARNSIKERTGGRDVHMLIMACAALNAARVQVPIMLNAILNQVKSQVTSSIIVSGYDNQICHELMVLAREMSEESRKFRRFRGEHQILAVSGELSPVANKAQGSSWHKGTYFMLQIHRGGVADETDFEHVTSKDFFESGPDTMGYMTIRFWGHSRQPITTLLEDVQKRISESTKLTVVEMGSHAEKKSQRNKRPLSTIDLDPKMMQEITADIELFFHKDSQTWYENSGRPYRHGYLFAGPPGTGKSSLLAGVTSHVNVPLYLINLQGMDDHDLREAFSRVPFRSCIGLEDIDCVGVDVSNRGAQRSNPQLGPKAQSSGSDVVQEKAEMQALETMMTQFMDKQAAANFRVLDQVKAMKAATLEYLGDDDNDEPNQKKGKTPSDSADFAPKSVALSGLLNVIDGVSATEGRLIIITTNHPEKLDPALYRAGRVERRFDISYASNASSIMTFKRLFDNDVCKRYNKSRITTAELAKYCGQYRGRPDIAVKEFADWLERGADKFSCPVDFANLVDEEGIYNVPEPFDEELLQVSAHDLVDAIAAVASGIEVATEAQTDNRRSGFWNPLKAMNDLLLDSGEYANLECIEGSLLSVHVHAEHVIKLSDDPLEHPSTPEDTETCHIDKPSPDASKIGLVFDPPRPPHDGCKTQITENCIGLGLGTPPLGLSSAQHALPIYELFPDFEDGDFSDDTEPLLKNHVSTVASPTSSGESPWDQVHHNQASPVRSVASVKFSEPGKLALASPRPIAVDYTTPEQERNDSVVDDSDLDDFDTAEE